ncbi:hypothetical protein [Streptomyces sp. NPDC018584]|uniref:hypothetical protein n=1 Tax=unclassified Streptomyces TaxID=2593676 RepID=UPI0037B05C78
MTHRPTAMLAALTTLVLIAATIRHRRLRRALHAERAARRLADAAHHRDLNAFTRRLHAAIGTHHVLAEADLILDAALATHLDDPHPEGGPA